jgi:hypothetical protein
LINVSSREVIFESNPNSPAKKGHHACTKLMNAALNILTETEDGAAWKMRNAAMNTVNLGYGRAAPKILEQWRKSGREACQLGCTMGLAEWHIASGE